MPPPVRQRYNAKARSAVAGGSSHKKRRRSGGKGESGSVVVQERGGEDDGVGSGEEDEGPSHREQLRSTLNIPSETPISSKKRKRLDSYINKKLKQESRIESLRLLASHALPASTSAQLRSTATLGQNPTAPLSASERVARREDLDVRRALARRAGGGDWTGADEDVEMGGQEEEEDTKTRKERERESKRDRNGRVVEVVQAPGAVVEDKTAIIAGGAKPGKGGKNKGPRKANWSNLVSTQPEASSSDFDSSDSANDSDSAEDDDADQPTDIPMAETSRAAEERARSASPKGKAVDRGIPAVESKGAPPQQPTGGVGSALKRSADGQVVQPRVVRRIAKPKVTRLTGAEKRLLRKRQQILDAAMEGDGSDNSEDESGTGSDGSEDCDSSALSSGEGESGDDSHEEDSDEDDDNEAEEDASDASDGPDEQLDTPEASAPPPKKKLAFKDWALKQMGVASAPNLLEQRAAVKVKTEPSAPLPHVGPLGAKFEIPQTSLLKREAEPSAAMKQDVKPGKPDAWPIIKRRPSVDEARQGLPIVAEEQSIVEAILLHPVVVICGETGSGKTTGVPQMLYEAGFGFPGSDNPGMIAVTQPRRVAAVSLAIRVADELNMPKGSSIVAHQIRYSSTTSPDTAIKFLTDGVLLRELAGDFLLRRYSVVIVDEAHERGVNTDVLVGVLSRVAKLREKMWRERKDGVRPLRIVIMSATLRVSDFSANKTLFATPPPVLNIAARQHPVTVHFNRRTTGDYVTEALKKVVKIHARLPPGGILVFMTGQGEIQALCRKLEKRFGKQALRDRRKAAAARISGNDARAEEARRWEEEADAAIAKEVVKPNVTDGGLELEDLEAADQDLAGDVDDGDQEEDPDALDSDNEDDDILGDLGLDKEESDVPMHILPLYSLLSNEQQLKVFKPPPEGSRLVVVATNVAETSLTIPNIKYVVDTGRAKERQYDVSTGVQTFRVSWISKASAAQRAGRAGRTGPGHCYRLYSSAVFENHFEEFSPPEILRMPIEGIVLQMKSMSIDAVINFPFPTPPDRVGLQKAEAVLTHLQALDQLTATRMVNGMEKKGSIGGKITDLGKAMANFPVTPRYAKMLVMGTQHECLPFIIAIVAGLSVGDPFLREEAIGLGPEDEEDKEDGDIADVVPEMQHIRDGDLRAKEERKAKRRSYYKSQAQFSALGTGLSDVFKLLSVIGASEYEASLEAFCSKHFLRLKAMREVHQLRAQLASIARSVLGDSAIKLGQKMKQPTDKQLKVIRQVICAAFIDQMAIRADLISKSSASKGNVYATTKGIAYRAMGLGSSVEGSQEDVFVHPGSVLASNSPPEWICYGEVTRSAQSGKVWLKTLTKVNPTWLSSLGKSLCTFSRPLDMPSTAVQARVAAASGKNGSATAKEADERDVFVTPHFGNLGIELPPIKAKQVRQGGRWVLQV